MARRPMRARQWSGRRAQELTALCLAYYGTDCHLCGAKSAATTADHVIPRSKGGTNDLANLRPACQPCNSARGDMDLADWFAGHPLPRREPLAPSRAW